MDAKLQSAEVAPGQGPRPGPLRRLHRMAGASAIWLNNLLRPRLSLGVRLAAYDPDGRVFLVRHSYLPGWHLPGGAVELGETCRAAAEREAREEGGLVLADAPQLFQIYRREMPGLRDHVALFLSRDAMSEAGARPGAYPEIVEAGFFAEDALPEELTPGTARRLAELAGRVAPSDHW